MSDLVVSSLAKVLSCFTTETDIRVRLVITDHFNLPSLTVYTCTKDRNIQVCNNAMPWLRGNIWEIQFTVTTLMGKMMTMIVCGIVEALIFASIAVRYHKTVDLGLNVLVICTTETTIWKVHLVQLRSR